MGGSIGFSIREKDGTEHRMCRWTNSMPYFINTPKFIHQDPQHLKKYLNTWYEMVDSYKSGAYKNEQFTMADVYAPYPFLAPMGYGLVVVDYKSLNVLHLQGYTSFGRLLPSDINSATQGYEENSDEYLNDIKQLYAENRIINVKCYDKREEAQNHFPIIDLNGMTLETIIENCAQFKGDVRWNEIQLNMNPWTITRFKETSQGLKELKQAILDLGFTLNIQEEEMWNQQLMHFKNIEKEA